MNEKLKNAPAGKAPAPVRKPPQRRARPNQQGQPAAASRRTEGAKTAKRASQVADAAVAAAVQSAAGRRMPRGYAQRRRPAPGGESAVPVKIIPLGGLGEVGKNTTLYECQGDMILVDCGIVFPDSDMYGIDFVIPDFSYVVENKEHIKGVLITHGHEDHIGALPYLLKKVDLPIYATRLTIGLIKNKLEEHGLLRSTKLIEITPKRKIRLGCFTVEPIHVNHSIPDAVGFAIECPAGVILQTGDFKVDYTPISGGPTDLVTIGEYGKKGVLALLSDSTNSERPGFTSTELKVGQSFATLFQRAQKKRIIIATFASNVYRIQQIINQYPPEKIVLVTTGSQGEPLSALSRMSSASHRNVRVGEGDFIIISANPIPGNEKMVTKVINGLLRLGAEVIYESMYDVHVSGHACQEEQKLMLTLAKPQFFIPVHGEYKHLKKHAQTAIAVGVPEQNVYIGENGSCIILSKDGIREGEPVQAGAVLVDGLGVGDVGNVVMRDRRHLSEDGLVIVVAAVEPISGRVVSGPELVTRGFVYVRESEELIDGARDTVRAALEKITPGDMRDFSSVKTRIRETVSSYLYRRTKRSPMILPIILEV